MQAICLQWRREEGSSTPLFCGQSGKIAGKQIFENLIGGNMSSVGGFSSEYLQNEALETMVQKAMEIGVHRGVAFVLVKSKRAPSGIVQFKVVNNVLVRRARTDDSNDVGTNYFGIAMEKLAIMMALGIDSGLVKNHIKKGEVPYRGGLIRFEDKMGYVIYVGFSGGTEDQDVEIATIGMQKLFSDEEKS